jgi:hypothetical protein
MFGGLNAAQNTSAFQAVRPKSDDAIASSSKHSFLSTVSRPIFDQPLSPIWREPFQFALVTKVPKGRVNEDHDGAVQERVRDDVAQADVSGEFYARLRKN